MIRKLMLILMVLLLASCQSKDIKVKQYYIAVIPKTGTSNFYRDVKAGVDSAASEHGVRVTFDGSLNEEDWEMQNFYLEKAIDAKADAIVISPIDSSKSSELLKKAIKNGITVVTMDSKVDIDKIYGYVGTDNYQSGKMMAQHLKETYTEKISVGIVDFNDQSDSTLKRRQGFIEELSKYDNTKIESIIKTSSNVSDTSDLTKKMIQDNPSINTIVTFSENTTMGVGYAIRDLSKQDDIMVFGYDNNERIIGMIESCEIDKIIVQNSFAIGYMAIETAINGIESKGKKQDDIFTDILIVDLDNLYEYNNQKFVFSFYN
ncbi:MAG: substrate-binding domain-containing protein [Anaerorhabdus sp.]